MKKSILILCLSLVARLAHAQTTPETAPQTGSSRYGVKGGLNISSLVSDKSNVGAIAGFHVGGFVEVKLSDRFCVQPELIYSVQGAEDKSFRNSSAVKVTERLKLNYLNIPIMVKFYAVDKLYFDAGPQVGFLINAKDKIDASTQSGSSSDNVDVTNYINAVDFAFNLGLGYEFTNNISAEARFSGGFKEVFEQEVYGSGKNSVFSVSIAYKF